MGYVASCAGGAVRYRRLVQRGTVTTRVLERGLHCWTAGISNWPRRRLGNAPLPDCCPEASHRRARSGTPTPLVMTCVTT